jgi:DNA-binding GntR family transcriptional regulator
MQILSAQRAEPSRNRESGPRLPAINLAERNRVPGPGGLAGEIVSIMEDRMTVGHYEAGEMLTFGRLAAEFGVSRQPVSIAISHLRTLGYVDIVPQAGCRVASPPLAELLDFFAVVSRIEGAVTAMAANRYEGDEGLDLLAIRPGITFSEIGDIEIRLRYVNYLHGFHDHIWRMARAPLLFNQLRGLRRLSSFYLWQGRKNLTPEAARTLSAQRQIIAELIVARDAKAAAEMMEQHVREKPRIVWSLDEAD